MTVNLKFGLAWYFSHAIFKNMSASLLLLAVAVASKWNGQIFDVKFLSQFV